MAGFIKKGIVIVLMTMIFMVPTMVNAAMESGAGSGGYHQTLYTEVIKNLYTQYPYVSIAESMLVIGANNLTAGSLTLEAATGGHFKIHPTLNHKNLILTTKDVSPPESTSGSIYIYPGSDESAGDIIMAHTGTNKRGYVGIGTSDPSSQLEVAGNIELSDGGYVTSTGNFIIRLS
ncbi:MAG: hypothetical protein WC758_05205 [Candidatus Woesearchaeota archaeon]|jgi:hypothetical protein